VNIDTQHEVQNESEFYRRLNALTLAITDTIESVVPKLRPSPYTKCWWSKELSQKRAEVWKLGRRSYTLRGHPDEPAHRTYKTARNQYGTMIEMAKRTHWEEFLQSVDDKTVWSAHHYTASAPSDGGKARIPTLCLENQLDGPASIAATNEEKTNTFMKTFFSSQNQKN